MTEGRVSVRASKNPFEDAGLPDADIKPIKTDLVARSLAFCGYIV